MRIAIFPDLHDARLMSAEKCIESLTFSLLITKSHHFQKSDNIWALQSIFWIYTVFFRSIVLMGGHFNFDGDKLKTNIQMSFQKVFLNSQLQEQLGKSVVKSKWLPSQGETELYRFFFWPNLMVGQNKIIFWKSFFGNIHKVNMPSKFWNRYSRPQGRVSCSYFIDTTCHIS